MIAFACAVNQFVPLLGERGLLPAARFVRLVPFGASRSLFYLSLRAHEEPIRSPRR